MPSVPFLPSNITGASDWLKMVGFSTTLATAATPGLFLTPGESDPASSITMTIVSGMQRLLRKLGYQVRTNGVMDQASVQAVRQVVGANWMSMPWVAIYREISIARNFPAQVPTLGDVSPSQMDCSSGTYCKGKDTSTITLFQDLQGQLNRLKDRANYAALAVDGKIGKNTATAAALATTYLLANFSPFVSASARPIFEAIAFPNSPSYQYVAQYADALAYELRRLGNILLVSQAPAPTPPPAGKTTNVVIGSPTASGLGGDSMLPIAIGAVGIGWLLFSGRLGGKGRGRRSARRSRRR